MQQNFQSELQLCFAIYCTASNRCSNEDLLLRNADLLGVGHAFILIPPWPQYYLSECSPAYITGVDPSFLSPPQAMYLSRFASLFSLALVAVGQDVSIRAVKKAFNDADVRQTQVTRPR
jgi:hypothetical protein